MSRYRILITSLFLLMLAMGLYAEEDDQPRWNTTLFGALFSNGTTEFGFGGAVGYNFTSRLELEGEIYTISLQDIIGVSGGFLYNFDIAHNKISPYILAGVTQLIGEEVSPFAMFGAGVKINLKRRFKLRLDLRFHPYEDGIWTKFSTGLMWSF